MNGTSSTNDILYWLFSGSANTSISIGVTLGSWSFICLFITLAIRSAVVSEQGKKRYWFKFKPKLGFKILSPGKVVNRLTILFFIAPKS
jgi:hypothetical protein